MVMAAAAALLAGCTTSVPAPVVDRNARPTAAPPAEVRVTPPATVAPANPNLPGNTPGSQFHVVQRGETLFGIARSNGVDVASLTAWNNMVPGAPLREGQVIRLSPPLGSAPAIAGAGTTITTVPSAGLIQGQPLPPAGAAPSLSPITASPPVPVVTPIEAPLKREPKSQRVPYSDAALAAMQRGETAATSAAPVNVDSRSVAPAVAVAPAGVASSPAASQPGTAASAGAAVDIEIKPGVGVERDGIAWTWPTSGKVASKFSDKAPMKGIDIAANPGASVVAAASGKVIYVGKEPRGYGQMIVVNHAKETVSVYFHTDKVQVKEQQRVLLGQKLAEIADGVGNKMHFEVRRQGRPLDPVSLMPR